MSVQNWRIDNLIPQSDTACVQEKQNQPKSAAPASSPWQKTNFANCVRYIPSGTYFARIKVGGKLIRQSLKTEVLSVAKMRLADLDRQERQHADSGRAAVRGKMAVSAAIETHRQRVTGDVSLKPRTKEYHEQRITALLKSWPGLDKRELRSITKTDCTAWGAKFGATASPTAFNHTLGILRTLFEIGMEAGARYDNPAKHIKRTKERAKPPVLPETGQFEKFVADIASGGSRDSRHCADMVRFLAYGGFRKSEAANITWSDCDTEKGEIVVRGDPETGTKNWTIRRVPMIPEMKMLLQHLRAERADAKPGDPVMQVKECQKSMNRAAKSVGMTRITHHDLRHLFATRCIESGVDIPTVSRWLGHKDGGALAMRVYGHLRDAHSTSMAAKVTFAAPQPENVVNFKKAEAA